MKKRWMSILLVAIVSVSALILGACSKEQAAQSGQESAPSPSVSGVSGTSEDTNAGPFDALKNFKAADLDGNTVTQDIFTGYEMTMVNIWATFCGPCINEMPELSQLKKIYADKGVNVVGIVVDITDSSGNVTSDGFALAKDIVSKTGADYTHIIPSSDLDALMNSVTVVPTTVFVDSEGNVVDEEYLGALDLENWSRVIDYLLEQ